MAKTVYVTRAQRDAARLIMKRDAAKGQPSRPLVIKIANAVERRAATNHNDVEGSATPPDK